MNATGKLESTAQVADDVESSGVRAEVESSGVSEQVLASGVRVGQHAGEQDEAAPAPAMTEETALGRLLFGWGTLATVAGMITGGLWVGPIGAFLGAIVGSAVGIVTVAVVVAMRRPKPETK